MINKIMLDMFEFSNQPHDVAHWMKVHSFARLLAQEEKCDLKQQMIIEIASILHDIACEGLRARYNKADGKLQEIEGKVLSSKFLEKYELDQEIKDRVIYLVSHHHTYDQIDGIDYQILLEADFLVNADEAKMSKTAIVASRNSWFKTQTGINLLDTLYLK